MVVWGVVAQQHCNACTNLHATPHTTICDPLMIIQQPACTNIKHLHSTTALNFAMIADIIWLFYLIGVCRAYIYIIYWFKFGHILCEYLNKRHSKIVLFFIGLSRYTARPTNTLLYLVISPNCSGEFLNPSIFFTCEIFSRMRIFLEPWDFFYTRDFFPYLGKNYFTRFFFILMRIFLDPWDFFNRGNFFHACKNIYFSEIILLQIYFHLFSMYFLYIKNTVIWNVWVTS